METFESIFRSNISVHKFCSVLIPRVDDRGVGVRIPVEPRFVYYFKSSRPALGPIQPPIQWILGSLSLRVKRPGHETDHSTSTSAEVKKMWVYTSTPPYAFMA
jgi:hypothetical protein